MNFTASDRAFEESKELLLLKIISWAQKNGKAVQSLRPFEIELAVKSKA